MMKRPSATIFAAVAAAALSACGTVDPLDGVEPGSMGITSVTAMFTGELYENDPNASFTGYPDGQGSILIAVPYFYPESSDNVVTEDLLKSMRVYASAETGTTITPGLGVMDMTRSYALTAEDAAGRTIDYVLSAEITMLSGCDIESFVVTSGEVAYTGVILKSAGTISIMTSYDELADCTVEYRISNHATLSGYTEGMTIRDGDRFEVTAHNGVDKSVYTISFGIPEKIGYGARQGSGRTLWTKYYASDYRLGLTSDDVPLRLAASGDFLYILTGTGAVHCVNRSTGAYVGTVSLPSGLSADSIVNDEAGHILLAADAAAGEAFSVYAADSFDGEARLLISGTNTVTYSNMGNIRVAGDISGSAAVTATADGIRGGMAWQIADGVAGEGLEIDFSGDDTLVYLYNGCFQPASGNLSDGMFAFGYWGVYDVYYSSGLSGFSVAVETEQNSNDNTNCLSCVSFNGARYLAYGVGSHFTWGTNPTVYIVDSTNPLTMGSSQLDYIPYSALDAGGWIGETGATADVLLVVSEDGYYMDLYYTDGNYGVLNCYEFDCIQQ